MSDLSVGQLVADKYRIDAILGSGGMGVVVAATHLELGRRVALKFLREDSAESIVRFQREARLIGRLKSAHVARVFDVGFFEDKHFIVMELLEGKDFAGVLERAGGTLPVDQAVDYILEACDAIAEAHAHGVVHRDLKPANLFLTQGRGGASTVKVLDFGISKSLVRMTVDGTTGGLTNEGMAIGSPGYMSPEQMTGALDVDIRADIFSLGAVLYRFTGGRPPYTGDSLVSILASMVSSRPTVLGELVPGIPEGFDAVVTRCLARFPRDRYQSIAELAEALVPYGARRPKAAAARIAATLSTTPRPDRARPTGPVRIEERHDTPPPITTLDALPPTEERPSAPSTAPRAPPSPPALDESNAAASREVTSQAGGRALSPRTRSLVGAGLAVLSLIAVVVWVGTHRPGEAPSTLPEGDPPGATTAIPLLTTPPPPPTLLGASPEPPRPPDGGEPHLARPHVPGSPGPRHRPGAAASAPPSPGAIPGDRH